MRIKIPIPKFLSGWDAFFLVGLSLMAFGAGSIYQPLGFIVLGLGFMFIGMAGDS